MLVKDYMTPNPITATPETTHKQATELLREHNIQHLPVVDKRGKLVGIVVEADLFSAQPSPATSLSIYEIHSLLSRLQLKEIMRHPVYTIAENCSLEEAARIMLQRQVGCLPVMRGEQLVGIITDTDIFQAFVGLLGGGREGARFTLHVMDRPGVLAKIAQAVADAGGNIVSVVAWHSKNDPQPFITIKEQGANLAQLQTALASLEEELVHIETGPSDCEQHG